MNRKLARSVHFPIRRSTWVVLGLVGVVGQVSVAAETTELVLQMETSLSSDSNPFRFYDQANNLAPNEPTTNSNQFRQRDTVAGTDVRAGAIIPLVSERTRLILTGSLGNRHYKNYKDLDHHLTAGDATLDWAAGHTFNGHVSAGKEDSLFQYLNGSLTERDISHQKRAATDLNFKLTDEWSVNAKIDRASLHYDLPINQLYNFDEHSRWLSGRYYSPTGSYVEMGVRRSDTNFPDRSPQDIADLDQAYKESEAYLDMEWRYSTKSYTSAHVGVIKRQYDVLSERNTNLSNIIWRGIYLYSPKLRMELQLWDRPLSIVDRTVIYVLSKAARFDAQWKYSDKTKLNFSTLLQNSDNVLVPRLTAVSDGTSRKEKLYRLGLGGSYEFERGFRLFVDSFYEKVQRESDGINLKQTVFKLGLEYTFENLPGSSQHMGLSRYQQFLSAPAGQQ